MKRAALLLSVFSAAAFATGTAFPAAKGTPGYYCSEDTYAKRYQRHLKEINEWTRSRNVGSAAFFDAGRDMRQRERQFTEVFRRERAKITTAIRSCRNTSYRASKSAIMAALRKADTAAKNDVRNGQAAIRKDADKWPKRYRSIGKKWMDFVVRCVRRNAGHLGTGSASEWRAYRVRMQSRVNIMRRKALDAKKSAAQYEPMLDRRHKRMIGRLNRALLSLPLYPRPCSVAAAPTLGGWPGKWATNRGDLCIKGRAGGLTVTPVGGGLLQRRKGKVTVGSASASTVRGQWSIPSPKFDGRFEWRMTPGGGRFQGRFSEKPGQPMNRRWFGHRTGRC